MTKRPARPDDRDRRDTSPSEHRIIVPASTPTDSAGCALAARRMANPTASSRITASMNIFRATESLFRVADSNSFVGTAQTKLLASSAEGTPVHVYQVIRVGRAHQLAHALGTAVAVRPGGTHPCADSRHPLAGGRGRRRRRVRTRREALARRRARVHGVHLAVNVNAQTTWLEPVSDGEATNDARTVRSRK